MKKPTEAIERIRGFATLGDPWGGGESYANLRAILAYLDSIPEWPADLTRERLAGFAQRISGEHLDITDALRRLAAIAPKRGKRKGYLYERDDPILKKVRVWDEVDHAQLEPGWSKVGEVEIDA